MPLGDGVIMVLETFPTKKDTKQVLKLKKQVGMVVQKK